MLRRFDKDFTEQTLLDDYWYDTWAYIVEEDIAPLLIGEWGGHMDGGDNQKWMELLRDYMIKNHISHTFWCLNPNSGDTAGLLSYDFLSWDEKKYGMFEEALWQTQKTGKYIGLDHQQPLGVNNTGISLNDFYSNYANTEGSNIDGGKTSDGTVVSTDKPAVTTTKPNATSKPDVTTTKTTTVPTGSDDIFYGDANCDGLVDVGDAVKILQALGNPDEHTLSEQGVVNADVIDCGGGLTGMDSLAILAVDAKLITQANLPMTEAELSNSLK